jgi:hypothetical protein
VAEHLKAGLSRPHPLTRLAGVALAMVVPTTSAAEIPVHNSGSGMPHAIYLDFDGHFEPQSEYLCEGLSPLSYPEGWPLDVTASDISATVDPELVTAIWQAVADDFAPFNVNVTTDQTKAPGSTNTRTVRVAIGLLSLPELGVAPPICESDSLAHPAYLNPRISPVVFVALDPAQSVNARHIAKRVSHEAGHLYGLAHHLAAAVLLDDWIMASQRPAMRYIWRSGLNASGRLQNDPQHLAGILGLRQDEPMPATMKTFITSNPNGPSGLFAQGTFALSADGDDYVFTVGGAGSFNFEVMNGIWTHPLSPVIGSEPNARYRLEVRTQTGAIVLACPEATSFTLTASTQGSIGGLNCATQPANLVVGTTYRLRVARHSTSALPGNIGRYTVSVRGVPPRPPLPAPGVR